MNRRASIVAGIATLGVVAGLLAGPVPQGAAAYAGSDGRIALVRANQIFTVQPDGAGLTKLTSAGKNYRPRWSPDGRRIAYVHESASGARDIWLMSASGTGKQQVTHLGSVTAPSWSPDGKWLAFGSPLQKISTTAPFGEPQLMGGRLGDCCFDRAWEVETPVAWAPDGDRIAFQSPYGNDSPDHYLQTYSVARHVVTTRDSIGGACCGFGDFSDFAWSPDAKVLAYTLYELDYETFDPLPPRIHFVGPAGTRISRDYDKQPAFSPSGTRIAFTNTATGSPTIYVSRADGSGRRKVTAGYQPDWQPTATSPWAPPPPPAVDSTPPTLTVDPLTPRVGQQVGPSNLRDTDPSNDLTTVPVRMTWSAVDPNDSGVCSYDLGLFDYPDTQPIFSGQPTTRYDGVVDNGPWSRPWRTWQIVAHDCASNETTAHVSREATLVDDTFEAPTQYWPIVFSGSWGTSWYASWSGGSTRKTTEAGATASYTDWFGNDARLSLVMATGPDRGKAAVYVDGQRQTVVDTYEAAGRARVIVAGVLVPQGQHTVTIENLATPGHPRIDVDALILTASGYQW